MVTMANNPFCESMGQRVTCMEHFIPTQSLLYQFKITEQREALFAEELLLTAIMQVLTIRIAHSSLSVCDADKLLKSNCNVTQPQTVTIINI